MIRNFELQLQELEATYHRKIMSEENSDKRQFFYAEAYSVISNLISQYKKKETSGFHSSYAQFLKAFIEQKDILEIGCGYGISSICFADHARSVVGIEINDHLVEAAREKTCKQGIHNVTFYNMSACRLAFPSHSFDVVYSNDVLEHLHPDDMIIHLEQAYDVLKPNGYYICLMPSRLTGPHDSSCHYVAKGGNSQGLHLKEYTYEEFHQILKRIGFRLMISPFLPIGLVTKLGIIDLARRFWVNIRFKIFLERLWPIYRLPILLKFLGVGGIFVVAQKV